MFLKYAHPKLLFSEPFRLRWQGFPAIDLEPGHFDYLGKLGWRRVLLPAGKWGTKHDHWCIDYSGWPLYTNASLSEETAYEVARAAVDREKQIVWEPE